jgi:hypothetical protein
MTLHDKLARVREALADYMNYVPPSRDTGIALTLLDEIAAEIPVWQPIGSAPKQRGKSILVYCYGDKCVYTACWWNEEWVHFNESQPIIGLITHWMPIPATPKGGEV